MRNKLLLVVLAFALLIIGYLAWKKLNEPKTYTDPWPNSIDNVNTETKITGTFLDLIKVGKTLKCTYSNDIQSSKITGTSYISGNKMRTNVDILDGLGNTLSSYMVYDGNWVYSWTTSSVQGLKMSLADMEAKNAPANSGIDQKTNTLNNTFNYNCTNWSEDSSVFMLPNDIQFVDFSEMIKNFKP